MNLRCHDSPAQLPAATARDLKNGRGLCASGAAEADRGGICLILDFWLDRKSQLREFDQDKHVP